VADKLHEPGRCSGPVNRGALFNGLLHIQPAAVEQVVSAFDISPLLAVDSLAPHPDGIDSADHIDDLADGEWRDVFAPGSTTPDHAHFPDTQKLVKNRTAAEHHIVAHLNITRQKTVIGYDGAVAERDIVTKMNACHEKVAIADSGGRSLDRTPVNGDIFPKDVAVADDHFALCFKGMAEVLRRGADDGPVAHQIPVSERHPVRQNSMSLDGTIIPDHHLIPHKGVGADGHTISKDGLGTHDSGGVNAHGDLTQTPRTKISGMRGNMSPMRLRRQGLRVNGKAVIRIDSGEKLTPQFFEFLPAGKRGLDSMMDLVQFLFEELKFSVFLLIEYRVRKTLREG